MAAVMGGMTADAMVSHSGQSMAEEREYVMVAGLVFWMVGSRE